MTRRSYRALDRPPVAPDQDLAGRIADIERALGDLIASRAAPAPARTAPHGRSAEELTAAMWGANGRLGVPRRNPSRASAASGDTLSMRLLFMLPPRD